MNSKVRTVGGLSLALRRAAAARGDRVDPRAVHRGLLVLPGHPAVRELLCDLGGDCNRTGRRQLKACGMESADGPGSATLSEVLMSLTRFATLYLSRWSNVNGSAARTCETERGSAHGWNRRDAALATGGHIDDVRSSVAIIRRNPIKHDQATEETRSSPA